MLRRVVLVLAVALVAPLAISTSPALAVNACTLVSPHSSNLYVNTVSVSWTCTAAPSDVQLVWTYVSPPILTSPATSTTQDTLQISYSLPDAPTLTSDGVSLTFTNVNTSAVTTLYLSYAHQTGSISENPADLTTSTYVTSVSGSTSAGRLRP